MRHECHAVGCSRQVPPRMLMCARHWRKVPPILQTLVWSTFRSGQESDKRPSARYMVAHHLAVETVAHAEGHAEAAADHAMKATMWRERAAEMQPRPVGCTCHQEPGDSECAVHDTDATAPTKGE